MCDTDEIRKHSQSEIVETNECGFLSDCSGSGLDKLVSSLSDLNVRLDSRRKVTPAVFSENMKLREETHHLSRILLLLVSYSVVLIGC